MTVNKDVEEKKGEEESGDDNSESTGNLSSSINQSILTFIQKQTQNKSATAANGGVGIKRWDEVEDFKPSDFDLPDEELTDGRLTHHDTQLYRVQLRQIKRASREVKLSEKALVHLDHLSCDKYHALSQDILARTSLGGEEGGLEVGVGERVLLLLPSFIIFFSLQRGVVRVFFHFM